MKNISLPQFFFISYILAILLIPLFGTIDKLYPQQLIGSIVATSHLIYNYRKGYFNLNLSIPIVCVFLLIILAFVSISYAYNTSSAIIEFSHLFVAFLILLNSYLTIKNEKKLLGFIFLLISFTLILEIGAVLNRFIEFYQYTVIDKIGRIPLYNGLAGNINITAFSILMKSMFILYYLQNVSKFWKKILLFIIMILAFFAIALTGSRGALLSIWITIFVFSLVNIYKYLKYKNYQSLKLSLNYIIPFGISSLITELIFNTLRVSYRTGEIFTRGSESRLEYWWAAIRGFIDNPILGVGTGNWKIFSISYSKDYINSYVVPYHAHNDFLQLLAELGIFAGILILISVFFTVKPLIADSLKKNSMDGNLSIYLFLSFTVYFIDSLLNFPISRPINIYTFVILFSIVNLKYVKFKINDLKLKNIVLGLLVLISVSVIYVNTRAFKSSQQQLNLYLDFNNKNFDDPVDEIMKYEDVLPNITVTTMSIKTLKAFYLQQSGDTIQAIKVLKEGLKRKENPFLGLEESALSDIYGDLRQYDSAYKYGKIAYGKIKNNLSHVGNYFRAIIAENKNFDEAKALFNDSKNFNHEALWSAYVTIAYKNPDSFDIKRTLEISKQARELFPQDVNIKLIKQELDYGEESVVAAINLDNKGRYEYENGNFEKSFDLYQEASNFLPDEYSYYQNMALNKIALQDYDSALELLNYAIDSMIIPSEDTKIFSIRGGIRIVKGKINAGCGDLIYALSKGDELSKQIILENCSQFISNINYN